MSYSKRDIIYSSDNICACYIIMYNNSIYYYIGYYSQVKEKLYSDLLKINGILSKLKFYGQNDINKAIIDNKYSTNILHFF